MNELFTRRWDALRSEVEDSLHRCLPAEDTPPAVIHRAMAYSVFAGGKRLRAVLFLAVADALGWRHPERGEPAAAIELIHTYSLIHDDLPAMDDDDLRRGKPTSHKVFGEAMAILAGDALLTHAFQLLSRYPDGAEYAGRRLDVIEEVARAAGTPAGMVAGQVLDIHAPGQTADPTLLHEIHRLKTGAMIRVSVRAAARLAGTDDDTLVRLTAFSEALGLAFQITDDILDETASPQTLGKTPGKDRQQDKLTFPRLYGLAQSRTLAERTVADGLTALDAIGGGVDTTFLADIARFVLRRPH
ncbi:MAG: polyprenyl synthetase family protein [Acidobacteria bacterium]|nr:polyprenyl synthetase family protein [Acidobacteriota bacterium]